MSARLHWNMWWRVSRRKAAPTAALASLFALIALPGIALAAENVSAARDVRFIHESDAAAWKRWSPRDEIAPQFSFEPRAGRDGRGALKMAARASSDFGAWRRTFDGFRPGQSYRFNAWYRATAVENERRSVIARLEWLDASGKPVRVSVRPPEYPLDVARDGGWVKMESIVRVPETAAGLDVQLSLAFTERGAVWWDAVTLTEVDSPPARVIRAMTVHLRPRNSPSAQASVEQFCEVVRQAADQKPDIICLPEGITVGQEWRSCALP